MKFITFLLLLLFTYNNALSQDYYVKTDDLSKEQYIDETKNIINIVVDENAISGEYLQADYLDDYTRDYLIIKDREYYYIITRHLKYTIEEIVKIKTNYDIDRILKYIEKEKLYKKVDVVAKYGEIKLISSNALNKKIEEKERQKQYKEEQRLLEKEKEEKFIKFTKLDDYIGTYIVKISKVDSQNYLDYDIKGKLFVTEKGISIKFPDVYGMNDLRVYYDKTTRYDENSEGSFICREPNDEKAIIVVSINKNKTVGSVSRSKYSQNTTAIFRIEKFQ